MWILRSFLLLALLFSSLFPLPAQSSGVAGQGQARLSAIEIYRIGRNMEAQNHMTEADVYYNEAIRICQDEVSWNAATRDTYTAITWALNRQQKYADVITWGERGLRLYADEYRVVETMGEAYFYLRDYERSLIFMQRYTNASPQGERISVAYFFIGEIFRLAGKNRHADIAYTTAVRLEPGIALWWFRLGSVREALGDYPQAVEAYQRALLLNSNYREANDGLTRSRNRQGNAD
ncbi:MAG: tetratricopeptide repeat protein [Treponema sp.]|jgi:tetratricopeptide (TPR) repeat protein|nr:tetratricopeptide repeat protein [Treponema sp.]